MGLGHELPWSLFKCFDFGIMLKVKMSKLVKRNLGKVCSTVEFLKSKKTQQKFGSVQCLIENFEKYTKSYSKDLKFSS